MNTILTFTDGSPYAASVYDHTAWAAQRLEAFVRVIHTLNPHREKAALADFSGNIGPEAYNNLMNDLVAFDRERARLSQVKGEAILAEAKRHLEEAGIQNLDTELRHGLFTDVLESLKGEKELIIIGKRGQNAAIEMKHLGTNIERCLRVAHCPVLVTSRAFKPIKRCLLAYDGGPSSEQALDYIAKSPLLAEAQVDVLKVGSSNAANNEKVAAVKKELEIAGIQSECRVVEGEPAKVITKEVEESGYDLLAMGAFGHSKAKRLLIGSTTATLTRDCLVPILMFR